MASANIQRIVDEVRRLPPDERRQLLDVLDREERAEVRQSDRAVDLSRELRWIEEHRAEYAGQWVAVRGDELLGSGADGKQVYEAARAAGDERPFITRVEPADELPFAGW